MDRLREGAFQNQKIKLVGRIIYTTMNFLKKIWSKIKSLFKKHSVSEGSAIPVEIPFFNFVKKEPILNQNTLKEELILLRGFQANLDIKYAAIDALIVSNNRDIDFLLSEIINYSNKAHEFTEVLFWKGVSELSCKSATDFNIFFEERLLLKGFQKREKLRKQADDINKKQVKQKLTEIEILISQSRLPEAKALLIEVAPFIRPFYDKEILRIKKAKNLIKEKDLHVFTKNQEAIIKQQKEHADRIKQLEEETVALNKSKVEKEKLSFEEKATLRIGKQQGLESLLIEKTSWEGIKNFLTVNQIDRLFHFTDRSNLSSIKKMKGLFSWHYCDRNGLIIPVPGGDTFSRQLDIRHQLHDYVRLSFVRDHPMKFVAKRDARIFDPIVLEIAPEVCYFIETRFSNKNAAASNHLNGSELEDLKLIDCSIFKKSYFDLDQNGKELFQAEVMVKTWIPLEYILNINSL